MERSLTLLRALAALVLGYVIVVLVLMFYWDSEPAVFDVRENAREQMRVGTDTVVGDVTTAALVRVMHTVLEKRGGYLSNDIFPPGVFMDNMPSWEFGVITQSRDLVRALRNDFSRSQTQSVEDVDLVVADPQFHFDTRSWILPDTEGEYRRGIEALERYLARLSDGNPQDGQFYARADNLRDWLAIVEKRLGSLSQRLSASVGRARVNTDLQGDRAAARSKTAPDEVLVKTPWLEIDDVFYEARGSAWALLHFLKAIEVDLRGVLQDKNALVSMRQIIRELEATQAPVWSPVILNGDGFGMLANHSLVMASYLSRANAAVIDLRSLLAQG